MTLTQVFAPITKTEKAADGTLLVYGVATGPQLDGDGQICDADWLKSAMPEWFETGANIREMHQPSAVGVGTDLEQIGDDHHLTAKIVKAEAVKLTDEGVYQGFSIGIKGPRIVKDAGAPNGRIVGGRIIEVSLVDRPCNGAAKLMLAKLEDDDVIQVEELVKDAGALDDATIAGNVLDENGAPVVEEDVDFVAVARDALANWLASEAAEVAANAGSAYVVRIIANLLSDLDWAVEADICDDMNAATAAMKVALTTTSEDPMDLTKLAAITKAATADDASDADKAAAAELTKALGVDDLREQLVAQAEQIDTLKTEAAEATEERKTLVADVAKVMNTVVDTGPKRTTTPTGNGRTRDEFVAKAAHFRHLSSAVFDRDQAAAYSRLAAEAEFAAASL